MYCSECGHAALSNAKFCSNCGIKIQSLQDNPYHENQDNSTYNNFINNYDINISIKDYICILKALTHTTMPAIANIEFEANKIRKTKISINYFIKHIEKIDTEEIFDDIELSSVKLLYLNAIKDINILIKFLTSLDGSNSEKYFSQFILDKEQTSLSLARDINTIIRQEMSRIYSSLASKISKIKSQQKVWNEITNGGTNDNIADFVQYLAGGALAVANPMIGIPMLVGRFLSGKSKKSKNQIFMESFARDCDDLINYCATAENKRLDTITQIRNLVENKFSKIFEHLIKSIDVYTHKSNSIDKNMVANFIFNTMKCDIKKISTDINSDWICDFILNEDISFELKKCFVS